MTHVYTSRLDFEFHANFCRLNNGYFEFKSEFFHVLMTKMCWCFSINSLTDSTFIFFSFFYFQFLAYFLPVVSQDYITRVHEIDVILGNSGLLKCEIPSFVIDFVTVVSWISDQGIDYFSKTQSGNFQASWNFFFKMKSLGELWTPIFCCMNFQIPPVSTS